MRKTWGHHATLSEVAPGLLRATADTRAPAAQRSTRSHRRERARPPSLSSSGRRAQFARSGAGGDADNKTRAVRASGAAPVR